MKKFIKIICISLFFLIPSGCGKHASSEKKTEAAIFFRLTENPVTLDPCQVVDVTGGELCAKIFSGLVRYDENLEIVPDLAREYEIQDEGRRYLFVLRDHLQFADGTPITASDVIFSWKRVLHPKTLSPRNWVFAMIKGASAFMKGETEELPGLISPDEHTVIVELEKPFAPFLSLITMPAASVVSRTYYHMNNHDMAHKPLGSGPYCFEKWDPDIRIILKPNPFYFLQTKRPCLVYKVIPEEASALAMLSTGELDIMKLPRQQTEIWKKKFSSLCFASVEELNTYYIGFDMRKPWIDLPFRKAVASAVNIQELIESIMGGQAVPASTPVPSVLIKNITPSPAISYSNNNAREFLIQSQAKEKKLIFLAPSVKETVSISTIILDQLKRLGLDVELKVLDWSSFKEALSKGEGDIFVLSWWADYADPENFLFPTFYSANKGPAGNRVYYKNTKMDEALLELQTQTNPVNRRQILSMILNQIHHDLPWIPLWHRVSTYAISSRIKGFTPFPLYSMDKGLNIYVNDTRSDSR
ncbi:MAG: ABC transporter substrate-binding protein [Candidatus Aureabacteria bacterium]|nr:ABC transporter substrate-binding protein [Candidatus Auribacterota bacterium]